MKWQNLKNGCCPICGGMLRDGDGPYNILKCVHSSCTFKIREDRLQDILEDKSHAVNRYKTEEENLAALNNL